MRSITLRLLPLIAFAMLLNPGVSAAAGTTYNVTITKAGNGSGTVTSNPAGINCGATCTATLPTASNNAVFTAVPDPGSRVAGWSGCSNQGDTCLFPPGPDAHITVTFEQVQPLTVTFAGAGTGEVWI